MKMNPELFSVSLCLLPEGTFCQSSSGAPTARNVRAKKGGAKGGQLSSVAEEALKTISTKNSLLAHRVSVDLHLQMGDCRDSELNKKRQAFRGLRDDVGDKRRAKELLQQYPEKSKDASDDESMDGFKETREDFCRDYVDAITKIESLDKHISSNAHGMSISTKAQLFPYPDLVVLKSPGPIPTLPVLIQMTNTPVTRIGMHMTVIM